MLFDILNWWAAWLMLGLISLPVSIKIFSLLGDKGYGVSRLFGLLIVSYAIWLGASLKMIPFTNTTIWIWMAIWTAVNGWLYVKDKKYYLGIFRKMALKWIRLELIFGAFLVFWSVVRSFSPDINGLEKFMDYGFMNSIIRSEFFPPHDMWYAGEPINYYYYGHYMSALMTRISGVDNPISYNLMIATILANSVIAVYALVGSLIETSLGGIKIKPMWWRLGGTLAVFLLVFRGNLHLGAYELGKIIVECPVGATSNDQCTSRIGGVNPAWFPNVGVPYWYPDATRYIPYTIHEFPIYSFVVADLHAHLINLPMVLLYLSFLVHLIKLRTQEGKVNYKWWLLAGFMLGVFYMTNAWDWPIYMLLTGLVLLYLEFGKILQFKLESWTWLAVLLASLLASLGVVLGLMSIGGWSMGLGDKFSIVAVGVLGLLSLLGWNALRQGKLGQKEEMWDVFLNLIWPCVILLVISILAALPFHLAFVQIAQGVELVNTRSELSKLITLWGWDWFMGLVLIAIMGFTRKGKNKNEGDLWDGIMIVFWSLGVLLILIPEIIYVKDIYIQEYHRANTMFKLVYQSWTLFAVVSSYTLIRLLKLKTTLGGSLVKWPVLAIAGLCIWQMGKYPITAVQSYYSVINPISGEISVSKGLDGELWLKNISRNEYDLLMELKRIEGKKTILEATGDSYTEFNRFSSYTGLPTVQGWLVHEWLWRGSYDGPGRRASEVEHMYTASNLDESRPVYQGQPIESVRQLISKYNIEYIVVGDKEREKYSSIGNGINEKMIEEIAEVVFSSGESKIYKVNNK